MLIADDGHYIYNRKGRLKAIFIYYGYFNRNFNVFTRTVYYVQVYIRATACCGVIGDFQRLLRQTLSRESLFFTRQNDLLNRKHVDKSLMGPCTVTTIII